MELLDLLLLNKMKKPGFVEETVVGNPVVFTANMLKPINSVVVPLTYTQSGSGDASQNNVRPISGVNGLWLVKAGKNMATIRGYSATNRAYADASVLSNNYGTSINTTSPESSVVITQTGASSDYANNNYRNGYISIRTDNMIDGQHYDVSFKVTDIVSNPLNASLSDIMAIPARGSGKIPDQIKDNVVIFKDIQYGEAVAYRQAWEIRNCGMSCTISEFMVTPSNTNDGEYEAYNGTKLNVTFPSGSSEIYGGTLDLITGIVTVDHIGFTSKISDYTNKTEYDGITRYGYYNISNNEVTYLNQECSIAKYIMVEESTLYDHFYVSNSLVNKTFVHLFLTGDVDETQKFTIVAPLKNPYTIQIDSNSMTQFVGVNTLWTNINDNITVKYLNKP